MGYTPEEVDQMTWMERRMFVEGLNQEFAPPEEESEDISWVSESSSDSPGHTPENTHSSDLSKFGLVAT